TQAMAVARERSRGRVGQRGGDVHAGEFGASRGDARRRRSAIRRGLVVSVPRQQGIRSRARGQATQRSGHPTTIRPRSAPRPATLPAAGRLVMNFDIRSAMLITSLLTVSVSASLWFAALRYPDHLRRAMRIWIGGLLLQMIALASAAIRGPYPSTALMIVVTNAIYALSYAEMGRAMDEFA